MMAFVLRLIWRQRGSVTEAVRTLGREGLRWVDELNVSQQAVEQRLSSMPPVLFERVLTEILPLLRARSLARQRPLPPALRWATDHFASVVALDGATLDARLHKTGRLRDSKKPVLAGRMAALLDVVTRLPQNVWYEPPQTAHDVCFRERALQALERNTLVRFDLGFLDFARFDELTQAEVWFVTRKKERVIVREKQVRCETDRLHDRIVRVGSNKKSACAHPMRLIAWQYRGKWYQYLTNVRDPLQLPPE